MVYILRPKLGNPLNGDEIINNVKFTNTIGRFFLYKKMYMFMKIIILGIVKSKFVLFFSPSHRYPNRVVFGILHPEYITWRFRYVQWVPFDRRFRIGCRTE